MKITHVRVSFKDGRYHRAIPGKPSKNIPHWLFDAIVILQTALEDLQSQAKRYNEEVKDKPMVVMKNHVESTVLAPGEIVKFPTSDEPEETASRGSP